MLYDKDQVWGAKQWQQLMATPEYQRFQKSERRRDARRRHIERQSEAANQQVPLRPPPGASSSRRPKPTKSAAAAATASSSSSIPARPSSSASCSTTRRREIGPPSPERPAVRKLVRQRLDPEELRRVGNQVAKEHRMLGNLASAGSVITPPTSSATSHRRGTGGSSLSRR